MCFLLDKNLCLQFCAGLSTISSWFVGSCSASKCFSCTPAHKSTCGVNFSIHSCQPGLLWVAGEGQRSFEPPHPADVRSRLEETCHEAVYLSALSRRKAQAVGVRDRGLPCRHLKLDERYPFPVWEKDKRL